MTKVTLLFLGLGLVVVGGIFTFQGLGYIGGSAMSGQDEWAIIGPGIAGLGVALVIVTTRPGG